MACLGIAILSGIFGFYANELFRRSSTLGWIIFGMFPLFLTYLWAGSWQTFDFFFPVKLYSLMGFACAILAVKSPRVLSKKWLFSIIYLFVILNIGEAVARSCLGSVPEILVGIAGLLLIVTLRPPSYMSVDSGNLHDFLWDVPYLWIIGYSTWNVLFVALTFPTGIVAALVFMVVPLLAAIQNNKLYVQARTFSLGLYVMVWFTFPEVEIFFALPKWGNRLFAWTSSLLIFGFMSVYSIYLYRLKKNKPVAIESSSTHIDNG